MVFAVQPAWNKIPLAEDLMEVFSKQACAIFQALCVVCVCVCVCVCVWCVCVGWGELYVHWCVHVMFLLYCWT